MKIFNDPVYGFISVPRGLPFEILEHPYFQRLRRIKQLGLTHYVYPGALHTRFAHALGALHLMSQAIDVLRSKGVVISEAEAEAVLCAILLHDIGHGPFSHALEFRLVNVHHEELTVMFMQELNEQFNGRLSLAIEIFEDRYSRRFLHQLISGQLDMDRLDYLTRDAFFTGVNEGVIGYDRIIKMLAVHEDRLVVEEKGIYSIERFLTARRLMYWQAYLHKTALCAEQMLIRVVIRAKELFEQGVEVKMSESLAFFFKEKFEASELVSRRKELLHYFSRLDDIDIVTLLKEGVYHTDPTFSFLSKGVINRRLYKVKQQSLPYESDFIEKLRQKARETFNLAGQEHLIDHYIIQIKESNSTYNVEKDEILILYKNGTVAPASEGTENYIQAGKVTRYYCCFPKDIS